jgi:release factor glutamine methyltransferase
MLTRYRDVRLLTPRGVFRPRSDAGTLIDAARDHIRGDVLDVCTGSGVVALSLARTADSLTAVDVSRASVAAVRLAALVNRAPVDVLHGDLFEPVAGRTFDVIVSNPPYLPTPEGDSTPGSHAWDGGHDGRAILDRLCREAPAHLRPGGDVFIVQSSLAGTDRTLALLAEAGLSTSVVAVHRGALGPLARARVDHLRAIGALRSADQVEEIAVVRGHRAG